jgi:hypothetical protein
MRRPRPQLKTDQQKRAQGTHSAGSYLDSTKSPRVHIVLYQQELAPPAGSFLWCVAGNSRGKGEEGRTSTESEHMFQEMGHELGHGGVERLGDWVAEVCDHERRRIDLANEPKIMSLLADIAILAEDEQRLRNMILPGIGKKGVSA